MLENQPDELSNDLKEDVFGFLLEYYKGNSQWEDALLINEKLVETRKKRNRKKTTCSDPRNNQI